MSGSQRTNPTRARRPAGTRGVPAAVRKRRILEAAGTVFSSRGYHNASMEEIAGCVGVTKPIVYAHFGSKEGLYLAYIQAAGDELLACMRGAADRSLDPAERLRRGVLEFLRFVDSRRAGWQVLYAEANARGGPLADEIAALRARITGMIKPLLARTVQASADGSPLSDAALEGLAHAFVGAGESLANWWLTQPDISVDGIAELLMAVVRPRPVETRRASRGA